MINRDILIQQLTLELMGGSDLNDEDTSLLAELMKHSSVQECFEADLNKIDALPEKVIPMSDTEIWQALSNELVKPARPLPKHRKSVHIEDSDSRVFQSNGDY